MCAHVHTTVSKGKTMMGSYWGNRGVLVYMCSYVYSSLYQQLKQRCSHRGSYIQVPATGVTGIQGSAPAQTMSEPSCWMDPRCTYVCIHVFPLADVHLEWPSCWCCLCSCEYPMSIYVAASTYVFLLCVSTIAHLPAIYSQPHYWLSWKPGAGAVLPLLG